MGQNSLSQVTKKVEWLQRIRMLKKGTTPICLQLYSSRTRARTHTHLTVKLLLSERKGKEVLLSVPSPHLGASPAHPFNLHSRYFPLPLLRSQTTQKLFFHCLPPTSSHCLVLSQSTANLCTQTHNKISK